MSTEEQQISTTSTAEEILNEQQHEDDEQQQQEHYEDDDVQNLQPQEGNQDLYHQTVASSSTAESSNRTLRDDNPEQNPVVIPRLNKLGLPTAYSRLSHRYTFTFSADLIAQFDKYRTHMRESIQQELVDKKIEEQPENNDEIFSVHQVHHEPATSIHSNSQASIRDRSTYNAPQKSTSFSKKLKKYFRVLILCGKPRNKDRNATTTTATTTTTLSDLATLSSDVDHQHQAPRTITTGSELTN